MAGKHDNGPSSFTQIYIYVLISLSVLGGIFNLYQFIRFVKERKQRFLSSRNPSLIIIFCCFSLFSCIVVAPLLFYFETYSNKYGETGEFILEFMEELITSILLTIIVCRTWLLYYDYNFAGASIDKNWRGKINPNEKNFWLDNRKKYGNLKFIYLILLILNIIAFVCLIGIAILVKITDDSSFYHYFTIFALGTPFVAFIAYISCKIKAIYDQFYIKIEIQLLSTFIIFRVFGLLIDQLVLNGIDEHTFFFTVEVVTMFSSVYIQIFWVLNKLKSEALEVSLNSNMIEIDSNLSEMIDVLSNKEGFELFLRHCCNELTVEHILFVIEISQYKATLNEYNCGNKLICDKFIDVSSSKFVQCSININIDNNRIIGPKKEIIFKKFQQSIFNQKWIPIARELSQTHTVHSIPHQIPIPLPNTPSSPEIQPISFAVIPRPPPQNEEENDHNDDNNNTVAIDWIYQYSKHLYTKYVDNAADLSINLPHKTRKNLTNVFSTKNGNETFQYIQLLHDVELTEYASMNIDITTFLQTYLYHAFDVSFCDIWSLLEQDTFLRFTATKQYSILCKKLNHE